MSDQLDILFREIQEGADELNSASDEINSIINTLEQKIVASKSGVQCWLESEPLYEGEPHQVQLGAQDLGHAWTDTILGFAKLKGEGWKLAVRECQFVVNDDNDSLSRPQLLDPTPLWRASRSLRIEALKKMPALFLAIRDTIKNSLETVASAKRLIE